MIDSNVSSATLNGNGATTSFPFAFKVFQTTQLEVWITDALDVTTKSTNWSATLTENGGTVLYPVTGSPLPAGHKITILRNMDFKQGLDLVNATAFQAQTIEDALDNVTMQVQQVKEAVDRSVKVDPGQTDPASLLTQIGDAVTSTSALAASAGASAVTATAQADIAVAKAVEATDSAAAAQAAAGGVKVSANDTASGPLETKLLPGENVSMTTQNDGGNETRTIDVVIPRKVTVAANVLNHRLLGGA